ncbi:amidohydrolase family protein [Fulvivirga sedimenti]|uniref:Amidohydrolase family protein n=1 Tax=Fulvivirga sedimenti TaxID=2879465 RepID=A0A9X1KZD6_9BACT|nr:amidohydrolase family protein [Fulvivirga sedimenti]MCA6078798.1 amidohydrolase family protein [Fulvivirga sedimenti]
MLNNMKLIKLIILLLFPLSGISQIAITAEKVYTLDGPMIENGVVLVKDGKIERVGKEGSVRIPKDYQVLTAKVVTPGLIDAHSAVGLSGYMNQPHDQDQLETSSPIQPELRAIDAYNSQEELVGYVRDWGVTTLHTGHGPGAIISGQMMTVKTVRDFDESAIIDPETMLAMTFDPSVSSNFTSPGTSSKLIAMIRTKLIAAGEYREKMADDNDKNDPPKDLQMDALTRLLNKETKALITVNTQTDILAAIRLAREFDIDLVLDEVAEGYLLIDEIKESGAQVVLHPTMARSTGSRENMTMESAAILNKAGIPFSIKSGFEAYVPKTRIILFEAAQAVANGLPYEEGLKSITYYPAQLLGISDRVGTIERGKDADLVLYNGDPFEYQTKVCQVLINGKVEKESCD